jgi:hypothetical protein
MAAAAASGALPDPLALDLFERLTRAERREAIRAYYSAPGGGAAWLLLPRKAAADHAPRPDAAMSYEGQEGLDSEYALEDVFLAMDAAEGRKPGEAPRRGAQHADDDEDDEDDEEDEEDEEVAADDEADEEEVAEEEEEEVTRGEDEEEEEEEKDEEEDDVAEEEEEEEEEQEEDEGHHDDHDDPLDDDEEEDLDSD